MMKKCFKGLITLGLIVLMAVLGQGTALANSMQSIDFHVVLQADGSGIVTETRQMSLSEDTEIYIVMDNLNGSEISNFQVSDFGQPLTYEANWNIDDSREEKSGKYGIVTTDSGYELCWGIGEYGDHQYTVTYTISGMVRQLSDGQGMNWQFFDGNGNINPAEMTITVEGPQPFTLENTKIWGFGFVGDIQLSDGRLVGRSMEPISDSNYVTILMQFSDAPFQPVLSLDQTMAEQESIAKEGSSYNQEDGSNNQGGNQGDSPSSLLDTLMGIGITLLMTISFIFVVIGLFLRNGAIQRAQPLISGKERRKLNQDKYYRQIPYPDGPMTDAAYMLEQVERGKIEDYFNAFLLKWLKSESIDHITEETGFIFKKNESILQLNRGQIEGSDLESRLWNMMQSAAGDDNKLAEKEFSKWAKKNYKEIDDLKNDLSKDSKATMVGNGFLVEKEVKVWKVFTSTVVSSTEKGEALLDHLVQFENYLKDFSLLNERGAREVMLWDELLIWASLYGIAAEVAKQFEKLYPQYAQESQFTPADFYVMSHFTNSFASGYHSGLSAASGGGGFTGGGGGGGSSGGGGGGSR